ncbi:gephyrin-like molybdotransferase Glp [Branchiibius sp. NY16-3462-2]|uniref:molybdopterin molybdotransferase MoeA n=1 Tax=Branchiibius sp. NY16-3462-2 TaxID=1807500 RepID=UPI000AFFFCFC|nr:gephyrin-like molybdotransferase Glp [Branchiibius sp. NY16-3462-2]
MLTPEEYRALLCERVPLLAAVDVPPVQSVGSTLAADAVSNVLLPGFDNSAMDGYAVRAADLPATLPVSLDIPAGDTRSLSLPAGSSARIMTGAPLPAGADAVVQVENVVVSGSSVQFPAAVPVGTAVRTAGSDVRPGDVVLTAGTRIAPTQLSALVSCGAPVLSVRRPARVAVVSTGDELREAGSDLLPGQLVDSNGPTIAALASAAGHEVTFVGRVGDTADEVRRVLTSVADRADAIITSGGVSAGAYEPLKLAFQDSGELDFYSVAMQPGKPQGFGILDGTPVFALPGNPVSVVVSFLVLVAPALRAMSGDLSPIRTVRVQAAAPWRRVDHRAQFARIRFTGDGRVEPAGGHGSHLIGGLAGADGLAIVPAGSPDIAVGDWVDVIGFPGR